MDLSNSEQDVSKAKGDVSADSNQISGKSQLHSPGNEEIQSDEMELRLKEIELKIKEQELRIKLEERRDSNFLRFSPVAAALITTLAGLLGSGLIYYQGLLNGNLELQRFEIQQDLERQKFTSSLILEVIKTGNKEQVAKNIFFLIDAGLIDNKDKRIEKALYIYREEQIEAPALPPANNNSGK